MLGFVLLWAIAEYDNGDILPFYDGTQVADWVAASGRATLFSYTIMHQVYDPAFADRVPYAVADVQLAEGPRMISNVIDCPTSNLRIGMPLEVTFDAVSPKIHLPRFRPATETRAGD